LAIQQIHETKQRDVKKKLRWYTKYRKLKKKSVQETYGEQQTCDRHVKNAKNIQTPTPTATASPKLKWIILIGCWEKEIYS